MRTSSLFLLLPVIFWGLSYIAIKIVLAELEPVEMISIRFLLAAPTLLTIILIKKIPLQVKAMRGRLVFSAFIVFLHFWVMAVGMRETSASNTAWILTTAPIFIAILSWIYLKEKFRSIQWLGLMVAATGVIALVYNGDMANLGWIRSRGDLIVLASCVTWAIYTVATRKLTSKINPLVATFWMTTIAGLVFIPYTFATSGIERFAHLQSDTYTALIFLGIFCLAIAFWLWSEGLARQTAAEVGVYLYVEPLITMVGAWIILSERITIWLIIGAILITIGVFISEKFGKVKLVEHDA